MYLSYGIITAIIYTMKTTIDHAGRVVIPKAVREAANLAAGAELEIRVVGDRIEIEPVPLKVKFVRRGGFTIAVAEHAQRKLTDVEVESVRQALQKEREDTHRGK